MWTSLKCRHFLDQENYSPNMKKEEKAVDGNFSPPVHKKSKTNGLMFFWRKRDVRRSSQQASMVKNEKKGGQGSIKI